MDVESARPIIPPPSAAPPKIKTGASEDAIRKTAKDFEAMVVGELIAPMFEALDSDGLGGGGEGEKMFRPMLVREYAKAMTANGGIGLSDAVAREMIRMQTMGAGNADPR
jgi:Rod binding domain-containing protein